jgi:hypothetical protein
MSADYGVEFSLRDIFEDPTVRELALAAEKAAEQADGRKYDGRK